jgi:hypothetical protein
LFATPSQAGLQSSRPNGFTTDADCFRHATAPAFDPLSAGVLLAFEQIISAGEKDSGKSRRQIAKN